MKNRRKRQREREKRCVHNSITIIQVLRMYVHVDVGSSVS